MKALVVASGIVFWGLVLGVIVLLFLPGGDGAEPVATVQIDQAAPPPGTASPNSIGLPPGFAVTGPAVAPAAPRRPAAPVLAPPGQETNMIPLTPGNINLPPPPRPPGPSGALDPDSLKPQGKEKAIADASRPKVMAASLVPGIDQTAKAPLPEVPASGLIESSPYGPLPVTANDGRRPADVYARPSIYAKAAGGPPRVAVLLKGLSPLGDRGGTIIKGLPPPVSLAYSAQGTAQGTALGRSLQERVSKARAAGHEILLAIPLEPKDYPAKDPGPHTLLTSLPPKDNIKRLHWAMSRYAGYVGVTNTMGTKFETELGSLAPVLEEIKRRGLLYVDDGSVEGSVAGRVATALELDFATADIHLDTGRMDKAFAKLEALAKERGSAIGVAKAAPSTVRRITAWAGSLEDKGLVLVPVSAAIVAPQQS